MNEKSFKEMDEALMKKTAPLREKKVSEGILRGFSASVERRIGSDKPAPRKARAVPVWAPALAMMLLAAVVAVRLPVHPSVTGEQAGQNVQETSVEEEVAALKELGAWNEEDDSLLGADDVEAQMLEFS